MIKRFSHKRILHALLLAGVLVFLVAIVVRFGGALSQRDVLRDTIQKAGWLGPFLFIGIIVAEVVIAPIPGGVLPLAAGFLFGFWFGTLYAYIGNVLGSVIAFSLARVLGQPLIERLFPKIKIDQASSFLERHSHHLTLAYMLPIFPVDLMSFLLGLSHFKYRRFLSIIGLGFLPYTLLLSLFGDYLFSAPVDIFLIAATIGGGAFIIFLIWGLYTFTWRNTRKR